MVWDFDAPGWDAIASACAEVYGEDRPRQFGTMLPWRVSPHEPLDALSVYASERDVAHWHFVTYGLSELYAKRAGDPERSGYGIELTFRLARLGEREPPAWATSLLVDLARRVVDGGQPFLPSHRLHLERPIVRDGSTEACALLFAEDPELGTIETPNGAVQFVQVVGVTDPDYDAALGWRTRGVLDVLGRVSPLLVTDLWRAPLASDPALAAELDRGIDTEGSTTSVLDVDVLAIGSEGGVATLVLGADVVDRLAKTIRGRLAHGRSLELVGGTPRTQVTLAPAEQSGVDEWIVSVTRGDAERIAASLRSDRGLLTWPELPFLRIEIRPR